MALGEQGYYFKLNSEQQHRGEVQADEIKSPASGQPAFVKPVAWHLSGSFAASANKGSSRRLFASVRNAGSMLLRGQGSVRRLSFLSSPSHGSAFWRNEEALAKEAEAEVTAEERERQTEIVRRVWRMQRGQTCYLLVGSLGSLVVGGASPVVAI
eukprot:3932536-Rhodomonas_salina.1